MSSILETCITLPWLYNYTQDNAMPWNWGMKEKLLLINTTVGVTIRGCGGAECLINNWAGSLSLYWLSVCTGQAYTGYHSVCCSHQTLHNAHCTQHNAHYTMHNAKCTLHTLTLTNDRVDCSAGQSVIKSKELNPVVGLSDHQDSLLFILIIVSWL